MSDFCGGRYLLLVRIQIFAAVLKPVFIPLRGGRRVRAPHDVDILIRLRVAIPQGSISTHAHASETFQCPSKLTCRDAIEIQDPFTYGTSFKIIIAPPHPLTSVPSPGDTAETKTIQPHKFHPLGFYLPHFTRFNSVENVKLPIPLHFPIQRLY